SCTPSGNRPDDGVPDPDAPTDSQPYLPDASPPADGAPLPGGTVLYAEGPLHSPITPAIAARLQAITAPGLSRQVFAKVGDSITVSPEFLYCFDGSFDLGAHDELAPTLSYFKTGDAAGTTPFSRDSLAARGGTTAADALAGDPCTLESELAEVDPRIAVVMFGTNEVRFGWTLDAAGTKLWALIDQTITRGTIPILSTIPGTVGFAEGDAQIPSFNRIVRAIAQGRHLPLVDFNRALEPLPNNGISSDQLHPSAAPGGGCVLTTAGLQYGYNMRNLVTLEALARVDAALDGEPANGAAPTRAGSGVAADPFVGALPLVDLVATTAGESAISNHGCGAPSTGHEVVYRVTLSQSTQLEAFVVDPDGVDVDVYIIAGGTCVSGDASATATVGPGPVDIVVDARTAGSDGEFILVVQPR
ncbi:MAG: SGNH/GDSL hydrolase family protein, partial [Deltaproteobacteria bacterium]|nr:SGNH/GDSL hydrolase family protein [Deltaproteobacteria bacterium]